MWRDSVGKVSHRKLFSHNSPVAEKLGSRSPITQFKSVDLPEPDTPVRVTTSPASTASDMAEKRDFSAFEIVRFLMFSMSTQSFSMPSKPIGSRRSQPEGSHR